MKRLSFLILLLLAAFMVSCNKHESTSGESVTVAKETNEYTETQAQNKYIQLPDVWQAWWIGTYTSIDRQLTLNDFVDVKLGMTMSEIVAIVGEPNGEVGSGFINPYYQLADNTYVILWIGPYDSSELGDIVVMDSSGRNFHVWKPVED